MEQAYRGINWTTIVLVGGMIPLSTAMQTSGAADEVADGLVDIVGDAGPYALLIGLFFVVAVLGQLISKRRRRRRHPRRGRRRHRARRVGPAGADVDVRRHLRRPADAGRHPANMMVMGPGGYRFGDYAKLGLPLLVWYFVIAIGLVPMIWQF